MNTNPNIKTHNNSNEAMLQANEAETDLNSTGSDVGAVETTGSSSNLTANPTPMSDSITMNEELSKLGETIGEFKAYDSQLPIADIAHTRIVKCLYQASPKTGKKLAANSYVRVATKHLTEEMILTRISELTPYILGYLQSIEDKMIKDYHKNGLLRITSGNLSLDKIISKLEESETSARLSKDKIEAWFMESLADALTTSIAAKLGLDDNCSESELMKLEAILNAYKSKFASLANPKVYIQESDCVAMSNVIASCNAGSSLLGARFLVKLESMSKQEENLLMSL